MTDEDLATAIASTISMVGRTSDAHLRTVLTDHVKRLLDAQAARAKEPAPQPTAPRYMFNTWPLTPPKITCGGLHAPDS